MQELKMKSIVRVPAIFLVAVLALAAAVSGLTPAEARANFDGNWSVMIVTDSGPCDRVYRYGVAIRNGSVVYEGSAAVNVAGRVGKNGAINVRVWAGSQGASGAGRLARDYGSGRWRGAGSFDSCAGSWTAERR
jgi:hypothetical protein